MTLPKIDSTTPEKVYAVWELDWEDQNVLSVWSTHEAAEKELERVKRTGNYHAYTYQISEHVVDAPSVEYPL